MRGIILAGGKGSRLSPLTSVISKQILPVYNKPMIYYPLSVLMLAGIQEILIISDFDNLKLFEKMLGKGEKFGIKLEYKEQKKANGIGEAFLIGEEFIGDDKVALILGDNIFYGNGFTGKLKSSAEIEEGAVIFSIYNKTPQNFGVIEIENEKIISLEEKPEFPKSNQIISGLYFFDNSVIKKAKENRKSARGELEIIPILQRYLDDNKLICNNLGRGMIWLDAGTFSGLLEAGNFVQTIEKQQGIMVACLEEIAYKNGWITKERLLKDTEGMENSEYGKYLLDLVR